MSIVVSDKEILKTKSESMSPYVDSCRDFFFAERVIKT